MDPTVVSQFLVRRFRMCPNEPLNDSELMDGTQPKSDATLETTILRNKIYNLEKDLF